MNGKTQFNGSIKAEGNFRKNLANWTLAGACALTLGTGYPSQPYASI